MRAFLLTSLLCLLPALSTSAQQLKLTIGENDIDVDNRRIYFTLATAARSAEIELFSPEGELLYSAREDYEDAAPGERLHIGWPYIGDAGENFRAELKFSDSKGNWVTFQVIRFYLEVPHEEVEFATAKWNIADKERPKLGEPLSLLKDAVSKYAKLMNIGLYVAGHTDTVGKASDNQKLSERRAQSIAKYFSAQGLKGIPIFVRGFGEGALAVKTPDNVAEQKNRRAQYIISSFVPQIAGPGSWRRVQ